MPGIRGAYCHFENWRALGGDPRFDCDSKQRGPPSCHQAALSGEMRCLIALIAMLVPAQAAEPLIGTWAGPHTFTLAPSSVWKENGREGSWRNDGTMLFLQVHMPPMFSYQPPPIACRFALSGDKLTLSNCTYSGEYTRR
jgi:hypothetical protein